MKVWLKVQLTIILALLGIGGGLFGSHYLIKKQGVVVVSTANKDCKNLNPGDIITEAGGNQIGNSNDFKSARFQPRQFVSLVVNSGPGGCVALDDGSLGIDVKDVSENAINFGVDLAGGKKYTLDTSDVPDSMLKNITNTLRVRTLYLGLGDVKIEDSNGRIVLVANENTDVKQLLFRGLLDANVQEEFSLKNGSSSFILGVNNYTISKVGNNYAIGNATHSLGDSFYLGNVKTVLKNETNSSVTLAFNIFNNSGILGEVPGYSQLSQDPSTGIYSYSMLVGLSPEAGRKFSEITQSIKTVVIGTQINLDAILVFNLDGSELSKLGLPVSLKGQNLNSIYIVVSDLSQPNLLKKKALVEASINGGSLPKEIKIAQSENIAATQKENAFAVAVVIVASLFVAPMILGNKFKKLKHNMFSVLIGTSEIAAIFSLFMLLITYRVNFSLDFPALIGLMLLSINWMINVVSLNLSAHAQKEMTLRIKYKKILSISGLTKILILLVAIWFSFFGYSTTAVVVFLGIMLDIILFKPFYKNFVQ